jgi:hypothetical protein
MSGICARFECVGSIKAILLSEIPVDAHAGIEDPAVIHKILAHLDDNVTSAATAWLPGCRASPVVEWLQILSVF